MTYNQYPPGEPPRQPSFTPNPQSQQPPPYGQQPYGQQVPYGPPQGRPPRRKSWPGRHKILTALGAVTGLILIIAIAIAAAAGSKQQHPAAPAAAAAATAAQSPSASQTSAAATPARAHSVATFTGSGIRNTEKFTVTDTWKLVYSFNCANFGQSGNFQVYEDGGFTGVTVNELSAGKSGSTWAYSDAGTHYLQVNSECDWTLKIIDEP